MPFTPDTVVADAIKTDPDVIDRLVALDPVFRKLKNPVLRKVMARLVRLRDAAQVAGVPLDTLMAAVNGAPAAAENGSPASDLAQPAVESPPDWLAGLDWDRAQHLDVRPVLAAGDEPLGLVMRRAAKVKDGEFLVLSAPFDPVPLRRVLGRKGFVSYARRLRREHWQVGFLRDPKRAETCRHEDRGTGEAPVWSEQDGTHIDVRGLEPPQPMRAIVKLIEDRQTEGPIIVHHEREPVFLYPELAERGWSHAIIAGDPGEVRLRLTEGRSQ